MKMRFCLFIFMSFIATLCLAYIPLLKQKRCDGRTVVKTKTECSSCAAGIKARCREGTKITSGGGIKSCSYTVDMGGVTLSMTGCTHYCLSVLIIPKCCDGYWGTSCYECPGGAANPCNGHGTCQDGRSDNGTCICDVGFTGFSCNKCAEDYLYGSDCSLVCECNHGICKKGISGDGSCICEAGYTGLKCDEVSLPCQALKCGENSRCIEVNRALQCQCMPGYVKRGNSCQSTDPCRPSPCSLYAFCTGLGQGKYKCKCKDGYYGDGTVCLPFNPCSINNGGCFENSTRCTYRSPGKSFCSCLPGMSSINPSRGCKAVSACNSLSCHKSAQCQLLTSGSYRCVCHEGEIGDGFACYGSILYELNKLNLEDAQMRKQPGAIRIFEEACGLTLRKYGPFTVFVPLMKVKTMNETEAKEFCKIHIAPGQYLQSDLMASTKQIWTLSGEILEFSYRQFQKKSEPGKTYRIINNDLPASNGVIHVIDLPITFDYVEIVGNQKMTIGDILATNEQFSRFQTMLENCALPSILNGHGSFTVFVPSNKAVDSLRDGRLIYLLTQGKHKLLELVKHHIFSTAAVTLDKLLTMPHILTSANEIVKINVTENGRILLGESGFVHSDIIASNGVIHSLDGILIPSSILPILPHICNETHYDVIKSECSTCNSVLPCPEDSIDLGRIDKGCSLGNGSNITLGCARNCNRAITKRGCCAGFYGHNCLPCPAGFSNPCYGRGVCVDGIHGNGKCECYAPFKGMACHICTNLNKHGVNCDEDCKCVHGTCDNRPGSGGVCQGHRCKPGYTGKFCDRTFQTCGELLLPLHCHINASCQSSDNITRCVCNDEFEGDGVSCQPIDLCRKPDHGGCSENALCTNVGPGNVNCQCIPGWTGDGIECTPLDNCISESRGGCHINADCIFTQPGENDCICKRGYAGDGYLCDAVDPCLEDNGGCHDLAQCKPLPGGDRSCSCTDGFDGDGLNCYGDIMMEMLRYPRLSMFNQWLKLSHIAISRDVNVTALVPTNTAMEAFSEEGKKLWFDSYMLPFLIRAHFLRGSFNSDQLVQYIGQELSTLDPRTKWEISDIRGNITIHKSSFIESNIPASNGFIFIIDKVLLPPIGNIPPARPSLSHQLDQIPAFSMFKKVLNNSWIIQEIESSEQKYTIFVPNNPAVLKFYSKHGENAMDNRTLKYHIIPGEKLSPTDLKSGVHKATLLGFSYWLMFYEQGNQTYVHDVPLDHTFYETKNGMIMGISGVLRILKNRCDTNNVLITKTTCTNCNKEIQCPEGSTLQEATVNGRETCMYQKRKRNVSGCKFICIGTTVVLECCSGYFSPQCLICPGGFNNVCSNNGDCQGGITGSGECICKEGFHGTACETCEAGRYGKDCKSECECIRGKCNDGLTGDGKCQCDKGWIGQSCEKDLKNDMCNGTCSDYANCMVEDSNSTASCSCVAGFTGNGTHCTEMDVCATHNGGCSEHAKCARQAPGEASCTCIEDYTGDGVLCIEINACQEHNGGCYRNAECVKTGPNKVACNCLPGYEGDGITSCLPINLCSKNNGDCSPMASCFWMGPGQRKCRCNVGFIGDGVTCLGNINEALRYDQEATIFANNIETQGVTDLATEGPFTVFVPQNQFILNSTMFAEWKSRGLLQHLLRYHIVGCKKLLNSDLQHETILTSLSGGQVKLSSKEDGIYVNNVAKILKTDIMATNGVIHFIDCVLDPQIQPRIGNASQKLDIIQAADAYGFSRFGKFLQDSKLISLVSDKLHQPFTMLWPTNEAFESLPEEHKNWLYHEDHKDKLQAFLKVHMIRNTKITAATLPQAKSLRTLHGSTISFTCSQTNIGDILVDENNARIIQRNMEFKNGIAHGISHLLEPPNIGARCDDFHKVRNTNLYERCSVCGFERDCPSGTIFTGETEACAFNSYNARIPFRLRYSISTWQTRLRPRYCRKICYSVNWQPACCKNHYGKDCHVCPGGLESPCSNHGVCDGGWFATGNCSCSEGFQGTACEICAPQRYGSSCKACNCTEHGMCNEGLSGDGSCFCTEGWSGEKCEIKLEVKPVCSPVCDVNATCRENNVCECDLYYEGDGRTCNVIDQCQDANGGCSVHANCIQIGVSRTCQCFTEYEGDGVICIPIDLCTNGLNGGCSEHATCTYTGPNTRKCECHDGYVGNGVQCLEKAIPPVNRCLEENGGCHSAATCTDLHFQETTAGVFHFQSPKGKYQLTYPEAEIYCESEGASIATFRQLSAAQQMGFHLCAVGWLQNWTAGYPTTYSSPACESNHIGIVDYKQRTNKSEMWDVFCYREQDVYCSCVYGYVGDGNFCNGNLLDVLEVTPNLSTFYSLLLNYANATEDGVEFLRFLSNGTSLKTLFVPEDGSFDKNLTLTWRDLEHHASDMDILLPYSNLTSGFILLSKIGSNLSISIPLSDNCTEYNCVKVVNDKIISQWDIPAFNGIIHIIKGPLKAPLVQETSVSHVTHPMAMGLTAALVILLLVISTMVGFFYYRQKSKGFRFHRFKFEDDDDDDSDGPVGRANPLVSIPNPMYGDGSNFYEPFEDSCDEGMCSDQN